MKQNHLLFFLFSSVFVFSQETISTNKIAIKKCKTNRCKIDFSIAITEQYLEIDQIEEAQKWLNYSKKLLLHCPNDSQQYTVNSLQSELFYYSGLFQFGLHEAQKAITLSKKANDSLLLSNAYLIAGINWYEMDKFVKAEHSLHKARKYFPNNFVSNYKRFQINREYIYNDIAQLKIKKKQFDSAYFYNEKAYYFAKIFKDNRCIANVERTYGNLYLKQNRKDSAHFYFSKSIKTSLDSAIYDTALLGYADIMECHSDDLQKAFFYFAEGEKIIKNHDVNLSFQNFFYEQSLATFQDMDDKMVLFNMQANLLSIEKNINEKGNLYIQNLTDDYIHSENKLLRSKINELDKQKNIKILQLLATVFFVFILSLVIVIFRRKNKLQKLILDQKNEISNDLHDDIGSELSSIIINTNLLKCFEVDDKQKILIDKISNTSFELSQRLNAFIWSLNTDNNTVHSFCEYVKNYCYKFFEGTEIKLVFIDDTVAITDKILNGNSRKNLFFCIKEILNNSFKHAKATQINVTLSSFNKKEFLISIQDNGIGIQETNKFGNGLINIKKRIAVLKGNLKIQSDKGLKICMRVPL